MVARRGPERQPPREQSAASGQRQQRDVVGPVRAGESTSSRSHSSSGSRRGAAAAAAASSVRRPASMSPDRLSTSPSVNSTSVAPARQHAGPLQRRRRRRRGAQHPGRPHRQELARAVGDQHRRRVPGRGDPQLTGGRVQRREQRRRHPLQPEQRPAGLQPVDHRRSAPALDQQRPVHAAQLPHRRRRGDVVPHHVADRERHVPPASCATS